MPPPHGSTSISSASRRRVRQGGREHRRAGAAAAADDGDDRSPTPVVAPAILPLRTASATRSAFVGGQRHHPLRADGDRRLPLGRSRLGAADQEDAAAARQARVRRSGGHRSASSSDGRRCRPHLVGSTARDAWTTRDTRCGRDAVDVVAQQRRRRPGRGYRHWSFISPQCVAAGRRASAVAPSWGWTTRLWMNEFQSVHRKRDSATSADFPDLSGQRKAPEKGRPPPGGEEAEVVVYQPRGVGLMHTRHKPSDAHYTHGKPSRRKSCLPSKAPVTCEKLQPPDTCRELPLCTLGRVCRHDRHLCWAL